MRVHFDDTEAKGKEVKEKGSKKWKNEGNEQKGSERSFRYVLMKGVGTKSKDKVGVGVVELNLVKV